MSKESKKQKEDKREMKQKYNEELGEDATLYGEFVCSAYHWISPEEQKINAKKLENITKEDK